MPTLAPVTVSVLMPVHNAERYVLQSVQSVLSQTFEDFELLVVDDCSTDGTPAVLSSIADRRIRIMRNDANLGVVGTLNRAMAAARGRLIARADADDLCLPTRFAEQVRFLDRHPDVLLIGSRVTLLEAGVIRQDHVVPPPALLHWAFQVRNPLPHPTMMFRAGVVDRLGAYLREEYRSAEDFDLSHRVLRLGNVAVLPDAHVIYRLHQSNVTRTRRDEMVARTAAVLRDAYAALLGGDPAAEAALIATHVLAGDPVKDLATLEQIGAVLDRLIDGFAAAHGLDEEQLGQVVAHAGAIWWAAVRNALRVGIVIPRSFGRDRFRFAKVGRPPLRRLARSAFGGLLDRNLWLSRRLGATPAPKQKPSAAIRLKEARFEPLPIRADDPPSLYVVVDTEAEFDWSGPFDRADTGVSATALQHRAQHVFDGYGLRPVYVVDYAIASQPEGYEPLRAILGRHACAVGAHLHPWTNPPFEEVVSAHNSYSGNLPADLEARKLRALVDVIERNFHVSPLFFKAGRYGLGERTMETLAELGFAIDFSILPRANLAPKGGVDFRSADAMPYHTAAGRIHSVPMTRTHLGPLAPLSPRLQGLLSSRPLQRLRIPGALARLRLANTVTLTPEGVTAEEQVELVRSMVRRGYRTFVLHYHSPSLVPGNTPYVRTEADLRTFLRRIETVCRSFFDELGGMPGNPADLLPPHMRERVWPSSQAGTAAPAAMHADAGPGWRPGF